MRVTFNDPEHQEKLVRDGFVAMPLLTADEVGGLLREFEALRPDDGFRRVAPLAGKPALRYHCTFLDGNVAYKRRARALLDEVFGPHVRQRLAGYEMLNANFYVKPPGAGVFEVHQNWPHLADMSDTTVTVWCPLVDCDVNNGTLEVVPGSQKLVDDIAGPRVPYFFRDFTETLVEQYLQPIPTRAGDSLIIDDNLIHWSANNEADSPRIAVQILFVPAGTQPVYYHFDPERPDRFEIYEIDAEWFVNHSAADLTSIARERRLLGTVPNRNRLLNETEFAAMLAARRRLGAPQTEN